MPITIVIKEIIEELTMGLACSQARLLSLTERKADLELNISLASMRKMTLTREMQQLSSEYNTKLKNKNIAYYDNGEYHKINYNYLMGYGKNYYPVTSGNKPLKENNSMILTDYKGQVVLSEAYATAIKAVLGTSASNSAGQGGTFSTDKIPEIMAKLIPGYTAEQFENGIESYTYSNTVTTTVSGEVVGTSTTDSSDKQNEMLQQIIDFYYPIFRAAATNGWTTEYNNSIGDNSDYVDDALTSGIFQLTSVNEYGEYDEGVSLTYFVTSGDLSTFSDSDTKEEINAWYNAEKARITEKETFIDLQMQDWSTEQNAINTEIQSLDSFIKDAISSVFGKSGE